MPDDVASVASGFIESFNDGDWDRFLAACASNITYDEKGTDRHAQGLDAILEVAKGWKAAFPDLRGKIVTAAGAGNTAVLEITWSGTHEGAIPLPNGTLEPTGKSVQFDDAQVYTIEGGKITSMRNYGDFLTMLSQLGALG